MIDTARKIFCDFQDLKQMCYEITSTLYSYDGFKKKKNYQVLLDNCNDNSSKTDVDNYSIVKRLILYKVFSYKSIDPARLSEDSLVEIQKIKLSKPIEVEYDAHYFDYAKFWKERYKKLLKY